MQETEQIFGGEHHTGKPARPAWQAMKRGFMGKCPHCGEGKLFKSFLRTYDKCEVCGEQLSLHRADDLPAYLVIVIVGHLVVPGFMALEALVVWSMWTHLALWTPITILLSLLLLQPVKGAVVGLQWAYYMHGFGGEHDVIDTHPETDTPARA